MVMVVLWGLLIAAGAVSAAPDILAVFEFPCDTGGRCVEAINDGSGVGVFGYTKNGTSGGVRGVAANSNPFGIGVFGKAGYVGVRGEGQLGGSFTGSSLGVAGHAPDGYGVQGTSTSSQGVYGRSDEANGVYGISYGATGTNYYGGRFIGQSRRGLFANGGNGYYDAYFPECARIGATVYGACAGQAPYAAGISLTAQNSGPDALAPGDVVAFQGMGEADGVSGGVVLVARATGAPGEVLVGVMQSALALEAAAEADKDEVDAAGEDRSYTVAGETQAGGLLLVQIQGIARVNVDAAAGAIIAGQSLTTAGNGFAAAAPAELAAGPAGLKVLGYALESWPEGSGAIYVMLGLR